MGTTLGDLRDRTTVAEILATLPDVQAIYRFGSSTLGTSVPDSDVDLAVLVARPLSPSARFDLLERAGHLD